MTTQIDRSLSALVRFILAVRRLAARFRLPMWAMELFTLVLAVAVAVMAVTLLDLVINHP